MYKQVEWKGDLGRFPTSISGVPRCINICSSPMHLYKCAFNCTCITVHIWELYTIKVKKCAYLIWTILRIMMILSPHVPAIIASPLFQMLKEVSPSLGYFCQIDCHSKEECNEYRFQIFLKKIELAVFSFQKWTKASQETESVKAESNHMLTSMVLGEQAQVHLINCNFLIVLVTFMLSSSFWGEKKFCTYCKIFVHMLPALLWLFLSPLINIFN